MDIIIYDVETSFEYGKGYTRIENFCNLSEAKEYINNTIKNGCLDYTEKMTLYKRTYNIERELLEEEILDVYMIKR